MTATTDMAALSALCAQALATMHQEQAELAAEADAATVEHAQMYAARVLGAEAAQALGAWACPGPAGMPAGTAQAAAEIAPGTQLVFSEHVQDGHWLALVTRCRSCGDRREVRIASLTDLAGAMPGTGAGR
jgi:hypothetical protein